jgi:hypothetical protein
MQRDRPMIRVEREVKGKNGKYRYRIPEYGLQSGPSRQPLLGLPRRSRNGRRPLPGNRAG